MINLLSGGTGLPQMPTAALDPLTTQGSAKFNQKFPQGIPADCGNGAELVNGVRYYSWTGTKRPPTCSTPATPFWSPWAGRLARRMTGWVSACSSRLGKHLGDYRQNHLDEVNQMVGLPRLVLCRPCHAVPPARQSPAKSGFVKGMRA